MKPLAKNIKRYFSLRELVIVFIAIALSITAGVGVFFSLKREVVINDNGEQKVVKTMKTTVQEVLDENEISITSDDYINLPMDAILQKKTINEINIKRAVPVNILVDGVAINRMTYRETVKDVLASSSIVLSPSDKLVGNTLDDKITSGMDIRIIRVSEQYVSEKNPIPFKVEARENHRMDEGKEKVVREGEEGIHEKVFKVVLEDGKEVVRQLIKDSMIQAPINKIVEYGTILNYKTARGDIVRYKKVLDMRATAYTASFKDTGKHPGDPGFGITYTGIRAKKGVIAVDPKVIPLGTKVYVEVAGSTPDYGFAVAADTGGAIKGNLIDLYYDSQEYVDKWGRKKVKVYILAD